MLDLKVSTLGAEKVNFSNTIATIQVVLNLQVNLLVRLRSAPPLVIFEGNVHFVILEGNDSIL